MKKPLNSDNIEPTENEKPQVRHVVNCWTIYLDDNDRAYTQIGRPQDWGDARWMYRVYTLEATIGGQAYRNEVHCWLEQEEPEETSEADHLELFAELICMITLPGWDRHRSTREFLDDDDFWDEEWGEMPPQWSEDEEE